MDGNEHIRQKLRRLSKRGCASHQYRPQRYWRRNTASWRSKSTRRADLQQDWRVINAHIFQLQFPRRQARITSTASRWNPVRKANARQFLTTRPPISKRRCHKQSLCSKRYILDLLKTRICFMGSRLANTKLGPHRSWW